MNSSSGQTIIPVYSLEGVLKYSQTGPAVGYHQQFDFTLLADKEGRWKMTLHTKLPSANLPVESMQHLAYDGTNIYSVNYSPQAVVARPGARPKLIPAKEKAGSGIISHGPYPTDYGGAVGILWFAFFGGQYLDSTTNRAYFPNLLLAQPRGDPMAWSCQLAYKLVGGSSPSIVEEASFYFDPQQFQEDLAKYPEMDEPVGQNSLDTLSDLFKRYKSLKPGNFLRSKYILDQTNRLRDCLFPSKFHVDLLAVGSSDASFRAECEITNVLQSTTPVDNKPPLDGLINVLDQRFRLKEATAWRGAIHYLLGSDGWIIDTNDPRIQAALARTPMRQILNKTYLRNGG